MTNSESIFFRKASRVFEITTSGENNIHFLPDGIPDVAPVDFDFDGRFFYIGGMNITKTTKYRNIMKNNNVALVIDDLKTVNPWDTRGIKIQGIAETVVREQLPELQLRYNNHFRSMYIRIKPSESGAGE
jgi:pyridoxamine 5'-phosphate oxidase family protein